MKSLVDSRRVAVLVVYGFVTAVSSAQRAILHRDCESESSAGHWCRCGRAVRWTHPHLKALSAQESRHGTRRLVLRRDLFDFHMDSASLVNFLKR